jgi:small subunit ribosomal protein S13
MLRIAGVDLPRNKRVKISLTYIFGIGRSRSNEILAGVGVELGTRVKSLSESQIARLRQFIDMNYEVEGDLRRRVRQNAQRLKEVGSYRGMRHRRNLSVRGQRTRTKALTRRGPRKTVAWRRRSRQKK